MRSLLCILAIAIFTGCATTHQPPKSGPTATLVLRAEYLKKNFFGPATHSWWVGTQGDERCFPVQELPEPKDEKEEVSVAVPAEQSLFIVVRRIQGGRICDLASSFKAEASKRYKVHYEGVLLGCSIRVNEVVSDQQLLPVQLQEALFNYAYSAKVCYNKSSSGQPNR